MKYLTYIENLEDKDLRLERLYDIRNELAIEMQVDICNESLYNRYTHQIQRISREIEKINSPFILENGKWQRIK